MSVAPGGTGSRRATGIALVLAAVILAATLFAATACSEPAGTTSSLVTTTSLATTTTLPVQGDWPTYHHDAARTGLSSDQEPLGQVSQAWVTPDLDGTLIYAQPLVVGDTVLVATEGNTVFALKAETGEIIWQTNLGAPVRGSDLPCGNIDPSGITGTPVVDTETGTVYVVAFLREGPHHQLFALDLKTGAAFWSRAIDPPGLSPVVEQQRGALTLFGDMIYVPYGGLAGDCGQYKGAVVAVPSDGSGTLISYTVPTDHMGGIWNPTGVVVDETGDIWLATGNSASLSNSAFDYGDAVIHLTPQLKVIDFFAPEDWVSLNRRDQDINTTAPVLLPGQRVLIVGKTGTVYLLDSTHLGGVGAPLATATVDSSAFGSIALMGSRAFIPCTSNLVALDVSSDLLLTAWNKDHGVGSPIVAAGHVWALGHDGMLRAYAPEDGTVVFELQLQGPASQFITLSAANGRLFVADRARVVALALR